LNRRERRKQRGEWGEGELWDCVGRGRERLALLSENVADPKSLFLRIQHVHGEVRNGTKMGFVLLSSTLT